MYVCDYMCMRICGFLWRPGYCSSPDVLFEHVCMADICIMGGFNRCSEQLDAPAHRCDHFGTSMEKNSNIRVSDLPSFNRSYLLQSWIGKSSFFMVIACNLICTSSISLLLLKSNKNAPQYPLLNPTASQSYTSCVAFQEVHNSHAQERRHSRFALFSDLISVESRLC